MAGRRITYLALLVLAVALHYAYGQYITHYMVIFLLCLPLLSLLISIPSALSAKVTLTGGEDVCRNRESRVFLKFECPSLIPPEGWSVTVESRNVFTGADPARHKVREGRVKEYEKVFSPDTSELGSISYRIKRAFISDLLGIIPIPVKKGGSVSITVLPVKEKPDPEPDLIVASTRSLKPKPHGFAEEHELRPYREGDALNLIHWKLSGKHEDLIVREPQEPVRQDIVIVINPPARYEEHRSVLEQHCYIDSELQEHNVRYVLHYGRTVYSINCPNDYEDFIRGVLSEHMKCEMAQMPERNKDVLIYRIKPGRRGRS